MATKIAGNTGVIAEVNTDNELKVAQTLDADKSGFNAISCEVNASGDGVGRIVRPADISPDYRIRIGMDSLLFGDTFSHGQINTSKYRVVNTTATNALSGNRWVLNSGNSVTSGQGTQFSTWASFKLHLSYPLYVDFEAQFAQVLQANNVCEMGWGLVSGVTAPTDGVMFRMNAVGIPQGVINYAGSETAVTLTDTPTHTWVPAPSTMYHFLIVIHNDRCEFWVDDVCMGVIETPASIGSPVATMSLPAFARIYNSGTVTTAQRLEISNMSVSFGDQNSTRLWPTTMAVMGQASVNVPDGTAAGFTCNYANSAAPASATLSNTAAGYTTLGGQWQFAAVAGAETDYALFGYLNPAGTNAIPGKNLIIRGITIDSINTGAAVATTATILQWGIGVGSSAVSLATTDSATAGGRAPRRVTLGIQSFAIADPVGKVANTIDINLDAPVVVEPGTYFHVILKMPIGTATASQVIRGTCFVNAYFE
jgi:hypothetical protein